MWSEQINKKHFKLIRITLGVYLCWHFLCLWPWAYELFAPGNMLKSLNLNPSYGFFPNVLLLTSVFSEFLSLFWILLIVASIGLILGKKVSWCSLFLWYGWACLFNCNNLILNPSLAFIGWLLLAIALLEYRQLRGMREVYFGGWLIMAIGYSISGWAKLQSPSWQDGTAILKVLNNPLARDYFLRDWISTWNPTILKGITWGTLGLELLFLPLAISQLSRKWAWITMVGLHVGILSVVDFTDLTLGMIVFHVFTFDWRWISNQGELNGKEQLQPRSV